MRPERCSLRPGVLALVVLAMIGSACATSVPKSSDARPIVFATTSIWADVASNIACDGSIIVESLIPRGVDAHIFEPSLRDRVRLESTALVIANGLGLEGRVASTVESYVADGGAVFVVEDALNAKALLVEEVAADPHIWLDPSLVAAVVPDLAATMAGATGASRDVLDECASSYVEMLVAADREATRSLEAIPEQKRKLVSNHDALRHFAAHYGFTVIGTVIESTSSLAEPSPAALERLATVMLAADVRSIFVEAGSSRKDAVGLGLLIEDLVVIELEVESLGAPGSGADTYLGLIVTNARRIADALGN